MAALPLAAAALHSAVPLASATAQATIEILQPVSVSEKSWRLSPDRKQRLITDEKGRRLVLRVIDFQ